MTFEFTGTGPSPLFSVQSFVVCCSFYSLVESVFDDCCLCVSDIGLDAAGGTGAAGLGFGGAGLGVLSGVLT